MKHPKIRLLPRAVFSVLLAASLGLTLLSLIGAFFRVVLKNELMELVWVFEVSADSNVPTWYASMTLLLCAVLLLLIGWLKQQVGDRFYRYWICLGAIFVLLSVDEVGEFHERAGNILEMPVAGGFLNYDWVVFGFVAVAAVGLIFLKFIKHLPVRFRRLFLLAALVFIGGALVTEAINGKLEYEFGYESIPYTLSTALEELCEMLGVAIFVYGLLSYLAEFIEGSPLQVWFSREVQQPLRIPSADLEPTNPKPTNLKPADLKPTETDFSRVTDQP